MAEHVRDFHLSDILSITTGRLVSTRYMSGVEEILNYLTGDDLMSHQLPRACGQCTPYLIGQYPALVTVEVPADLTDDTIRARWLAEQVERFGEYLPVRLLPPAQRVIRDPLSELQEMMSDKPVIVIEVPHE